MYNGLVTSTKENGGVFMINTKRICKCALTALVACSAITGLTGCSKEKAEERNILICQETPKEFSMNEYQFELAEDNKTINRLMFKLGYNKESIEKDFPDIPLDEAYELAVAKVNSFFEYMTINNSNVSWITGNVVLSEELYEAQMVLIFDFTDKNFDIQDESVKEYLNTISVYDNFYNEDEMRFEVTEKRMKELYKNNKEAGIACKTQTVEVKDKETK